MHFVSLVPLSTGITFVIVVALLKGFFLLAIALIALIAWIIYELFFKKDKPKKEERDEYDAEAEYWDNLSKKLEEDDSKFYREIGRLEQQLDDLEEQVGVKKRKRKK